MLGMVKYQAAGRRNIPHITGIQREAVHVEKLI
jgi:hypothetical protein